MHTTEVRIYKHLDSININPIDIASFISDLKAFEACDAGVQPESPHPLKLK